MRTKKQDQLTPAQKKALEKTITYFDNHRHMMRYDVYLRKGYPIATGVVEATCGSLVKNRMEQSGMRWSINGAQAVLAQRAILKNGDGMASSHTILTPNGSDGIQPYTTRARTLTKTPLNCPPPISYTLKLSL